ncbi:MAG: bifunctional [glutamate--ammonia ligase]-adenylyl-L-tyrosine phosphorylase/[glutamate--ammonia-ligase] adenylyltransferase [Gammaproteobacteria bacterium]|nr:MAG: bifunctional [glutamate--ammonia ligase]-adenylyl-L-tyrosine phosphorylase/[glutamate--ammonia-ligase] adenylyltransferase [Gammaproteobacteria bacterium]
MTNNFDFPLEEARKRCCAASNMVERFTEREPVKFSALINNIKKPAKRYDDYRQALTRLIDGKNEKELAKILRSFRIEQQVDLACRDILHQISVEDTLHCLSDLACACLDVTYHYVYDLLGKRYGFPLNATGQAQHLVIFGMGKLGGSELNFSSDIDLILAYPSKGETQGNVSGHKVIDNELFFHRLAQKLIYLLDNYDEHGFVYRVDMRLKPFGSVGTLCTTFAAMKRYYLEHGRNWERYALVKMRPVAGDITAGNQLLDDIAPFIYQRQVDYEAVSSIDEMKSKIVANSHERALRDNLKLGEGGIREIEFLVQTFQMMYGGRIVELRTQSLLTALQTLRDKDLLSEKVTNMLRVNYLRLRKIENAIQYFRDQQTHDLPNKAEPRAALLVALAIDDWLTLVDEVGRIRYEIFQLFKRVFATQDEGKQNIDELKLDEDYWLDLIYQTDITGESAEVIARDFVHFYRRMSQHDLGERYLIRLNWVLPQVIVALDGEPRPVKIAKHMLELLEAIAEESVYLSLLVEHPSVLKKIIRLFMHSSWMTKFLCKHPRVIDELIHENHEQTDPNAKQIHQELRHAISQCTNPQETIQKLMDFKNAMMFRTASADMQKKIRLMHVSDQLTWTAEGIIKAILKLAQKELIEKYGTPTCEIDGKEKIAEFGIIAYGKLGGLEMGYGSDLDLVFLHSSQGKNQVTNGQRSVDNHIFFTRLVGLFNNYITALTPSGKLYEVDIRLRPSGQSGLVVHSLNAFEQYQRNEAWTWEHQALVRARFIAGGKGIKKSFKKIRQRIITMPRDDQKLRQDVLSMREKIYQSFKNRPTKAFVHVKHERGGVTDIEFIVQYLLLKYTKKHRHLTRCSDNMRQLSALELFGVLRSADASELRNGYRKFRYWIHLQQLRGERAIAPVEQYYEEITAIRKIWKKVFKTE